MHHSPTYQGRRRAVRNRRPRDRYGRYVVRRRAPSATSLYVLWAWVLASWWAVSEVADTIGPGSVTAALALSVGVATLALAYLTLDRLVR